MQRLLAASVMFLLAVAQAGAQSSGGNKAETGKVVYKTKCASCHGQDAKGSPAMAKMFKLPPAALDLVDEDSLNKKDEELASIILKDKGKMPAFAKLKDDIDALIRYIRSLAPPVEKKGEGKAKQPEEKKPPEKKP